MNNPNYIVTDFIDVLCNLHELCTNPVMSTILSTLHKPIIRDK